MELLLRLSSGLPREIREEAFFLITHIPKGRFLSACARGEALFVEQCLIHKKVPIEYKVFKVAVWRNHPPVLSLLLGEPLSPLQKTRLLKIAVEHEHDECVSLLLEHGACVTLNIIEESILYHGSLSMLKMLIDPSDKDVDYLLRFALIEDNREITEYLLSLGAEVDPEEMEEIVSDDLLELLRMKKRNK